MIARVAFIMALIALPAVAGQRRTPKCHECGRRHGPIVITVIPPPDPMPGWMREELERLANPPKPDLSKLPPPGFN